jgi:acetate kinase
MSEETALVLNTGSSSIKFGLFGMSDAPHAAGTGLPGLHRRHRRAPQGNPQRDLYAARLVGVRIDPVANNEARERINAHDGAVEIFVIPTNEELIIARHCAAGLQSAA